MEVSLHESDSYPIIKVDSIAPTPEEYEKLLAGIDIPENVIVNVEYRESLLPPWMVEPLKQLGRR